MKLVYASLRPYYPIRIAHGGQRSTHELLSALQFYYGIECMAMCFVDPDYAVRYLPHSPDDWQSLGVENIVYGEDQLDVQCGYLISLYTSKPKFWHKLQSLCETSKPDLVLTGQRGALEIISFVRSRNIATLLNLDTSPSQGVYEIDDVVDATKLGAGVICCSQYVRDRIASACAIQATVVYPPMARSTYMVQKHMPIFVTAINPMKVKGGHIVEYLVKAMPDTLFQIVVGWELDAEQSYWSEYERNLNTCKNVLFLPRTPDIRTVMAKTKILIVPSQWDEAFGRVVWEAQCSGIPSIVSATGGLAEALGTGGELIYDFRNEDVWLSTLRRIISNHDEYERLRLAAYKDAIRDTFTPENSAKAFLQAVERMAK